MSDPTTTILTTSLSVAAFGISAFALWSQYLKPFAPVFHVRTPRLRFVQYTQEAGTFDGSADVSYKTWKPLVDVDLVVLNNGARHGAIVDFRLSFLSEKLSFALFADYVIDREKWEALGKKIGRVATSPHELQRSVEQESWTGLLLPKAGSHVGHLMFGTNSAGFRDVPTGVFRIVLEYSAGPASAWVPVCSYEFTFDEWSRSELKRGAAFIFGISQADRVWPKEWKDEDSLLMDEEIEGKLGLNQPRDS